MIEKRITGEFTYKNIEIAYTAVISDVYPDRVTTELAWGEEEKLTNEERDSLDWEDIDNKALDHAHAQLEEES